MFDRRDEWFQHEIQSHRVEWRCGQEGHTGYTDQVAFLAHMGELHQATADSAQTSIFLSMFERPKMVTTGTCCLCHREAENLKTHLAHHLEQIALFALPRENEIPEMDSEINIRGSDKQLSLAGISQVSGSDQMSARDAPSIEDTEASDEWEKALEDEGIIPIGSDVTTGLDASDVPISWTEVYQAVGKFETEDEHNELQAFAVSPRQSNEIEGKVIVLLPECLYLTSRRY